MHSQPTLKAPAHCSDGELSTFQAALVGHGEPDSPTLAARIRNALSLAFLDEPTGGLPNVGALKQPTADHVCGVFKRAGSKIASEQFNLELGWCGGADAALGLIIGALVTHAAKRAVFMIARSDYPALRSLLEMHSFRADGRPFESPRGSYLNQIFIRGQ